MKTLKTHSAMVQVSKQPQLSLDLPVDEALMWAGPAVGCFHIAQLADHSPIWNNMTVNLTQ